MSGYIYLIHMREFINSNEDIYKIGKTQNVCCRKINSRFCGYSKDSCIKIIMHVLNANEVELKLINIFVTLSIIYRGYIGNIQINSCHLT